MTDNAEQSEQKVPGPDQADAAARAGDPKAGDPKAEEPEGRPGHDAPCDHHRRRGAALHGDRRAGGAAPGRAHRRQVRRRGRPKAEVFVVAYTLDDADARTRPVTFAFNGGPGSSSVWLHLGLLGPRRVLMGDAGALLPPPYGLADNHETLLRHSDLVFIDPVSTGYSRAVKGEKSKDFHGYGGDVESVGEVIRLWTTRNGRWMSPKYLCGESYGTLRAAALAAAPAGTLRPVPQRPDPDLGRPGRRHAGVRRRQRRPVRAVPADLRGDRALPRPARRPAAARGARRGGGIRGAGLPVGAGARRAADRPTSAPRPSPSSRR